MGLSYAHGAIQWLSADAVNTTYVISGLAFQPKALRFWWTGIQSSTDATSTTADARRGMGFAVDTTHRRSCGTLSLDNVATASCATFAHDAAIAGTVSSAGAVDGLLDLSAVASDGFTAIVDDVVPVNLTVFWEAWGGSDMTVMAVGSITEPAASGNQSYSVTGLTAGATDQVVFLAGTKYTGAIPGGAALSSGFCVGATTGTASARNIMVGGNSVQTDSATQGWSHTGECLGMVPDTPDGTLNLRATLNSFDTDGFTLNYLETTAAARKFIYLAMKGGAWQAGSYTINDQTIGNTATVSGLSFTPIGFNLMGAGVDEDTTDRSRVEDGVALGCASSTSSRRSQGVGDRDGVSPSQIRTGLQYDQVLTTVISTLLGDFDVNAMNADGFQIIVDTAAGTSINEWQGYVAFGDAPVAGGAALMGQLVVVNP